MLQFIAKGYSQIKEINYQQIFSCVFNYESLRILFTVVASLSATKCKTHLQDVKNKLLNWNLKKED